jgi:hypothetical protein
MDDGSVPGLARPGPRILPNFAGDVWPTLTRKPFTWRETVFLVQIKHLSASSPRGCAQNAWALYGLGKSAT